MFLNYFIYLYSVVSLTHKNITEISVTCMYHVTFLLVFIYKYTQHWC